jgi:hypothetical protein
MNHGMEIEIDFRVQPLPQFGDKAYQCRCIVEPSIGGYNGFTGSEGLGRPIDALMAAIGQMQMEVYKQDRALRIMEERRRKERRYNA